MVRRDGAAIRKERIQEIAKLIRKLLFKNTKISLSKTIAALQYEFGLTKEKILEYLNIPESLGHFTLDNRKDKIRKVTDEEETEED